MEERYRREEVRDVPGIVRTVTAFVIVFLCTFAGRPACVPQDHETNQDVAARWATQQYGPVAKSAFGSPTAPEGLGPNTVWVVTARIRPAYNVDPEMQFSLTKLANGEVTATVIKLRTPLQVQLQRLYPKHPKASPSDLAELIELDRYILSQKQWAGLSELATAFEKVRTTVALENALTMDSRQYQIWVDAGSEQAYFNLLGPSSGEGGHPIIVWIEETGRRLQKAVDESRRNTLRPPG